MNRATSEVKMEAVVEADMSPVDLEEGEGKVRHIITWIYLADILILYHSSVDIYLRVLLICYNRSCY